MKNIVYPLVFQVIFACSGREKASQEARNDSVRVSDSPSLPGSMEAQSDKPVSKRAHALRSAKWQYEKKVNQAGETVFKASITSPVILQFGFPYTGGSTVALTIRQRAKEATVYLQVSNGQFNRSFQGGRVRIRFDGKPAITYTYSAAENGSATIIFFDEADQLIRQLKSAEKMIIDVSFYAQGNRQIDFRTAGLSWNH